MNLHARLTRAAMLTVFFVVASLFFSGAALAARTPLRVTINTGAGQVLRVSAGSRDLVRKSTRSGPSRFGCTQVLRTYRVGTAKAPVGTLSITIRTLPSGSRVVFSELKSPKTSVPVVLTVSSEATAAAFHDMGLRPDLTYNATTGVDRTSGPIGWVDLHKGGQAVGSVLASKSFQYTNLTKVYSKSKSSTVRRFISESRSLGIAAEPGDRVAVSTSLSARASTSQNYLLLTSRAIVDTSTANYSLARVTSSEWRWMDPLGSYGKAPYSIEPVTKLGYVRDLVDARASATYSAYKATDAGIFEDLLVNNLYSLSLTRSSDGLWRTNYTSTWVKAESGITAPFIDTRNNEQLAMSFLQSTEALSAHGVNSANGARGWAGSFASYLLGRARAGAVARTAHGAFFGDYYDSRGTLRTHTSLNHALGEMNYLMTLYLETKDTAYLTGALRIKGAVDDTGTRWVRSNSDLWYQRNINGKYTGGDYVWVTYWDLLNSQRLFKIILGSSDPVFNQLITAKAHYLGVTPTISSAPSSSQSAPAASSAAPTDRVELP